MNEVILIPAMNNTKWEELRLEMYALGDLRPRWRTRDLNGYVCPWDGEWFYHFREGGYDTIEWLEIETPTVLHDAAVLVLLRKIHVPGERIDRGFRIYGYVPDGIAVNWI